MVDSWDGYAYISHDEGLSWKTVATPDPDSYSERPFEIWEPTLAIGKSVLLSRRSYFTLSNPLLSRDEGGTWEPWEGYDIARGLNATSNVHIANDSTYAAGVNAAQRMQVIKATSIRAAGQDRYGTAVRVSQRAYPQGSDAVILASGRDFPDALSASSLAGVLDAPILLAAPDALDTQTATELRRLAPEAVYIVGGTSVITTALEDYLAALPHPPVVRRLAGADRYATSVRIAEEAVALGGSAQNILIALGANYPDA
ncbi:MAG: cell wall-binding repeat-containing protein, partial [Coriobacteriales bacterium]|nr:cell wall-binding repeat-containing protein [Coriobacteriales bacterium]